MEKHLEDIMRLMEEISKTMLEMQKNIEATGKHVILLEGRVTELENELNIERKPHGL